MIPGFVSGGEACLWEHKFYLGAHKSGKKEKYPYSNHFTTHSLYHEYFTMSNTHMKQKGVLLDLLNSTRKSQVGQLHRIETKIIMLWPLKNMCIIQQNRTISYNHRIPTWRTTHRSSFSPSASLSSSRVYIANTNRKHASIQQIGCSNWKTATKRNRDR